MNQLEDCLAYFRENPVFGRLLQGFWRKYASYGRFEGSVQVTFRDREERESLEGFLQKNFQGRKKTSVSARLLPRPWRKAVLPGWNRKLSWKPGSVRCPRHVPVSAVKKGSMAKILPKAADRDGRRAGLQLAHGNFGRKSENGTQPPGISPGMEPGLGNGQTGYL